MKKWIGPLCLAVVLGLTTISGCVTGSNGEQGIQTLEQMSELDFNKWKLYIQLGVKIGSNRLLSEGAVTTEELEIAAVTIETVRDQTGVPAAGSFIEDALTKAGFTNDEATLLLVIVEQELISRGALDWVNPETGVLEWSPRTKEMFTIVVGALRSATVVTDQEVQQGTRLESEFNSKML